jgi:hypothetical protein
MAITQEKLNETFNLFKTKFEGKKEDYFAPLYIADKHDKKLEDVFEFSVFGNNDYGIDGYYIDRDARNLYLYQFKWSENHEQFKGSYERLIKDGMEMIFGNPLQDSNLNPTIRKLKYELEEYKSLIDKVYLLFVFNGDIEKANGSKMLDSLKEDLENKRYLIDSFFERENISFLIDYKSNFSRAVISSSKTKKANVFHIDFSTDNPHTAPNGEKLRIGLVKLNDLHKMFLQMRSRLFEKNIRSGLSADNAPNRSIKKTLKEIILDTTTDPEYFTFNHNGVTIYAEKVDQENGTTKIIEPRVLNGAQTITTFARFIADNQTNPKLKENLKIVDEIKVIAKVITDAESEFVTNVTICNNRQNPVDPWNLRASDLIQCSFEDKFNAHGNGIHYDRQEGAFKNMTDDEREEKGILESKEINIKKLAQTFLALQGEVDKISRLTDVFENETAYRNTFKSEYLKADTRKIILFYKIHFRLPSIIRSIEDKGYNKYYWAGYAKNLIWALLVQGILNDNDIDDYLEKYGYSLTFETNFGVYLKDIASKKIRFILSDIANQSKYSEFLESDPPKYSFLKTKVIFNEAMNIAKKKYGWEKQTLK